MAKAKKKAAKQANRAVESYGPVTAKDLEALKDRLRELADKAEALRLGVVYKDGQTVMAWKVKSKDRAIKGLEAYMKGVDDAIRGIRGRGKAEPRGPKAAG